MIQPRRGIKEPQTWCSVLLSNSSCHQKSIIPARGFQAFSSETEQGGNPVPSPSLPVKVLTDGLAIGTPARAYCNSHSPLRAVRSNKGRGWRSPLLYFKLPVSLGHAAGLRKLEQNRWWVAISWVLAQTSWKLHKSSTSVFARGRLSRVTEGTELGGKDLNGLVPTRPSVQPPSAQPVMRPAKFRPRQLSGDGKGAGVVGRDRLIAAEWDLGRPSLYP